MLPFLAQILNVLVPFKSAPDAGPVPAPSAGTVVSPVTIITNAIIMVVTAVLTAKGVDAGTATTIAGGAAAFLASLVNLLHITGAANLNTLAQNPTAPAKDSAP